MDMRIGYGGDTPAAAGPARRAQGRHLDRRIIAELESIFIIQGVAEMIQQPLRFRASGQTVCTDDFMQVTDGPDITQDPFRIHIFINIQRPSVAFLVPDIAVMIPLLAAEQVRKICPFTGQTAVIRGRSHTPGAGERVIFQSGTGLFREYIRIFTVLIPAFLCPRNHTRGKGEPVRMNGPPLLFRFISLQDQVNALPDEIRGMSRGMLLVKPPAPVAPYAVLLCQIRKIVLFIDAVFHNMINTFQRLGTHFRVFQMKCGKQHGHRRRETVRPGNGRKEPVLIMIAPVKNEPCIAMVFRNPGVFHNRRGDFAYGIGNRSEGAGRFMVSGVDPLQDRMDLTLILRGNVKAVKEDGEGFSFPDGKTVFSRRAARLDMMGIHKHPRSVFIPEGIPYLSPLQRASESGILFKFSGDSRSPGFTAPIPAHIVGRGGHRRDPAVQKPHRTGMGQPVAANHPPGGSRKILLHPQARRLAVHNKRRFAPIRSVHKSRKEKPG